MSNMPLGQVEYADTKKFLLSGISFNDNQLQQSVTEVKNSCFDVQGQEKFNSFVSSISDTGFQNTSINNLPITSWQVGEGLAQAYLISHHNCHFPWSSNRDLKNPKSSLTGADLVGFHQGKFVFGEVKTSSENRQPAQVTSKKTDGLNTQLNNLCSDKNLRNTLIQYLFHRLNDNQNYKDALKKYLINDNDFTIFGVLVRDTSPNIRDWHYLQNNLQPHDRKRIFLIALYLLEGGINQLHELVATRGEE